MPLGCGTVFIFLLNVVAFFLILLVWSYIAEYSYYIFCSIFDHIIVVFRFIINRETNELFMITADDSQRE